jgi:hypothetical protein
MFIGEVREEDFQHSVGEVVHGWLLRQVAVRSVRLVQAGNKGWLGHM